MPLDDANATTWTRAKRSGPADPVTRAAWRRRLAPGWLVLLFAAAAAGASDLGAVGVPASSADGNPSAAALAGPSPGDRHAASRLPFESEGSAPDEIADETAPWAQPGGDALSEAHRPATDGFEPDGSKPGGIEPGGFEPGGFEPGGFDPAEFNPDAVSGARGVTRPGRTAVERDWFAGATDLAERANALRARVRRNGMPGFDAAARALVLGDGQRPTLARARAAVAIAPDLPLARVALAGALWREEGDAPAAVRAAVSAISALDRQIEASLVTRATLLSILAGTLALGGFAFLGIGALATARRAAHDIGDLLSIELGARSRGLLIGALVMLPASCGQGAVGLALGCFGLVIVAGERAWRRTAFVAAALLWLGLYPVLSRAGSAIASLDGDAVGRAAFAVETDAASHAELARLEAAQASDPVARRALAVRARRIGNLALANARYAPLVADPEVVDAALLNDAANVRLALGDVEGAIALYDAALARKESPELLFNLSQAYGAMIRTEEQDATLARAQRLDRDVVGALTALPTSAGDAVAVDLPAPVGALRARLLAGPSGGAVAREIRRWAAPGVLGSGSLMHVLAFALVGGVLVMATRGYTPTRFCRQCGARSCPRCDDPSASLAVCRDCARMLHRTGTAETQQRTERLSAIRARRARIDRLANVAAYAVPGAAGLLHGRPALSLVGAVIAAGALLASPVGPRPVVDPLAAGAAGEWLLAGLAFVLTLAHVGVVAVARSTGRD